MQSHGGFLKEKSRQNHGAKYLFTYYYLLLQIHYLTQIVCTTNANDYNVSYPKISYKKEQEMSCQQSLMSVYRLASNATMTCRSNLLSLKLCRLGH